ncbi:hypothetical protein G7Y89_g9848 [Cudoniella acicularis]|uniref:DUF6536 domain-containing protein n=1 Tax=Cudoniella acicularis TaxID=354080 RepID=A0A8H4RG61_9HELO|nr:hypothetical protein G7Y89_g9848 [Cudoniella acicularis]
MYSSNHYKSISRGGHPHKWEQVSQVETWEGFGDVDSDACVSVGARDDADGELKVGEREDDVIEEMVARRSKMKFNGKSSAEEKYCRKKRAEYRSAFRNAFRNRSFRDSGKFTATFSQNVGDILFFGFCSLPFHLFYNSAVFETVGATPFYWAVVGEDFLQSGAATPNSSITDPEFASVYANMRANGSHWDKLSNLECIKAYGPDIVTDRRNVLVVTTNSSRPDALYEAFLIEWATQNKGFGWMCPLTVDDAYAFTNNTAFYFPPGNCSISSLENGAANWTLSGVGGANVNIYDGSDSAANLSRLGVGEGYYPVDYCLSEPITSQCWVNLNWFFLMTVTVFNAIKVFVLVLWLREMREKGRLLTVEDMLRRLRRLGNRPRWWIQAPSKLLWILTVYLSILACGSAGACLWKALVNFKENSRGIDFNSLWNNGFGTISTTSLLSPPLHSTGTSPVPRLSILTNLPQVVLSILFFLYTSLLTTMVSYTTYNRPSPTVEELAKPAHRLPLHYTILISAFGVVTHWMASQAFFMASVQVLEYPPRNNDGGCRVCGFVGHEFEEISDGLEDTRPRRILHLHHQATLAEVFDSTRRSEALYFLYKRTLLRFKEPVTYSPFDINHL